MKRILKVFLALVFVIILAISSLMIFLTITEFSPSDIMPAETQFSEDSPLMSADKTLKLVTWNIGYGGLDEEEDVFLDGGTHVHPLDQAHVLENMNNIKRFLDEENADITLIQEIDVASSRTKKLNELDAIRSHLNTQSAFAPNFKCAFVPYPLPPIGTVYSGIATFSDYRIQDDASRIALACPFKWPVRTSNLKRCLLVTSFPLEGTDKSLVIINLHLEAYDNGEGKLAQTKALLSIIQEEYAKGNYVIAGGDFNQEFPDTEELYPIKETSNWVPPQLDADSLNEGWSYVCDPETPTCRLLNQPYDETSELTQHFVIDGFIVSPNITVEAVKTHDLHFKHSDHNPVALSFTLN